MINSNWTHWIVASVASHFNLYKGDLTYRIEGGAADKDVLRYLELKYDGPHYDEVSKNYTLITMDIALFLQIPKDNDLYSLTNYIGNILTGFSDIDVYKFGDDSESDSSLFACLRPIGPIRTATFDQTMKGVEVKQALIESRYEMELTDG
jgi:hypothetical protein